MPVLPGLGVITLDLELRVRSWNDWVVAATGIPELVARGRLVIEFVPASRRAVIGEQLAEVQESGAPRVLAPAIHRFLLLCPPPFPNPYFQEMQQRVTLAPLRDEIRTVGLIVTIDDVTSRMIEEREQARRVAEGVEPADLVTQAGADDWQLRASATRALKQSATAAEIAELLAALERDHGNFSVLSGALQVLVSAGHEVTAPLVGLLKNPSSNVRMHAALALGALGDAAGVQGLLAALGDEDSNVRFHAIEALGRLAAPDAVPGLQHIAASGDFFLSFPAIDALARIDDPGVMPALIALIDQEDLRPAIVDALATLGDEECVGVLVNLLNDGRGDVPQVAAALVRIAQRYEESFAAGSFIVDAARSALSPAGIQRLAAASQSGAVPVKSVFSVLGWVGVAGLEALVASLGNSDANVELAEAILGIGSPAVPQLVSQLEAGCRDARLASAFLLGAIGDARARDPLITALTSHDNELVTAAARALAALGDQGALDPLLALFEHPDVMVRQAAVAAVNSLGAVLSESRLVPLLDDPDPRVRECAIRASGYFAFDRCVDGIVRAVADEVEDVRRAALEQLPMFDDERGLALLLTALTRESPRNRAAAAHALRLIDGAQPDRALIEALGDEHAWVRYFAAGSLAHRRTGSATETLEAIARVDAAPHVRIAAVRALAVLDPAASLRVASMAFDDHDEEVAAAMIQSLSGSDGPQVEQLLERAIQSTSPVLRLAAAESLGGVGTPAAVQTLAWAARLSDPESLATVAMDSLRRLAASPGSSARSAVYALLQLGHDPVRRERVVQLLSTLSGPAIPTLAAELQSPRPEIRTIAVEALARMRDAAATEHIASALSDPDPRVRSVAVTAFGRLGSSGIAGAILTMSTDDADASVRRRATAVCRRYGWTSAARQPEAP